MGSGDEPKRRGALQRTTVALIGVPLALAVALGLLHFDLTHANRPHELRFTAWIAALAATSLWLSGLAASALLARLRAGGPGRTRARVGLGLALGGMLPGLGLLALCLYGLFTA